MKHRIVSLLTTATIIFIGIMNFQGGLIPAVDYTNRTGQNCTSCHPGTLNPTGGSASIGGTSSYYPGKTYTMTVSVTGGSVYGFSITSVLDTNTNTGAGTFSGTGYNVTSQSGRSYARHNPKKTPGSWSVSWVAPTTNMGTVKMFATGVAADNNGRNSGDKVYAVTKTITGLNKMQFTVNTTGVKCNGDTTGKAVINGLLGGAGGYKYKWGPGITTTADSAINLGAGTYTVTVSDKDSNTEVKSFTIQGPPAFTVTKGSTPSICGDSTGSAWVKASGLHGPLDIVWTNPSSSMDSITTLKAGVYNYQITDTIGCIEVGTVTVGEQGTNLGMQLVSNDENCNNGWGVARVQNIQNAIGNVSYTWSNGDNTSQIDSLSSGTYSVTIEDQEGCKLFDSVTVSNVDQAVNATLLGQNDKCNQSIGFVRVNNVIQGKSPFSYLWSDGSMTDSIGGLLAGVYHLTITDSLQCSQTFSDTILDEDAPTVSLSKVDLLCYGDSSGQLTSNTQGGKTPYSYQWSNGSTADNLTGLMAGNYILTVTDSNGCRVIDSLLVEEPAELKITTIEQDTTIQNDKQCDEVAFVIAQGGTMPFSYLWDDTASTMDSVLTNLCSGTYTVVITDANGCQIMKSIDVVDEVVSSVSLAEEMDLLHFYPTPVRSSFSVETRAAGIISLRTLNGKLVYEKMTSAGLFKIDMSDFDNGVYMLEFHPENSNSMVRKRVLKVGE